MSEQVDFKHEWLLECFKSSREELLFRIQHRDHWFKLNLIVLVAIWAAANGIEYQAKVAAAIPSLVLIAPPIAFAWAALYYVEDILVHQLSQYVAGLRGKAGGSATLVPAWDESEQLQEYAKDKGLRLRVAGQLAAFVVLPGYLARTHPGSASWVVFNMLAVGATGALVLIGYRKRRMTGHAPEAGAEDGTRG